MAQGPQTRLLITCHALDLSGSSTYTSTLARALKRTGIEVDVLTELGGALSAELRDAGIAVYNRLRQIRDTPYTCIIGQHKSIVTAVRRVRPDVPLVFISHGILPRQEQPPSAAVNVQKYIAVSQEVKERFIEHYAVPTDRVEVVHNFVDTKRFAPEREINESPRKLLFVSNRCTREVRATIHEACERMGLDFLMIGKKNPVQNVEHHMNKADIVVSLGRGIIEAMACGRAVIVYDYMGGDGMITVDNLASIRKYNFSGRCFRKQYGVQDMMEEIARYDRTMGAVNRDIAVRDHSVSLAIDRILRICDQAREMHHPPCEIRRKAMRWDPLWRGRALNRLLPPGSWPGRLILAARDRLRHKKMFKS